MAAQSHVDRPEVSRVPYHSIREQIFAGVLLKYVNLGKGWRHRLFILRGGVLRYYKVFGPSQVNVFQLFEQLRQDGDLIIIGAETALVENKYRRLVSTHGLGKAVAAGEVSLQVAHIRESGVDYRKFYVDTGTGQLKLKAETKEDRWAWIEALTNAKRKHPCTNYLEEYEEKVVLREQSAWQDLSPRLQGSLAPADAEDRIAKRDSAFLEKLEAIQKRLTERGASGEVNSYVSDVLLQQHQRYHESLAAEVDKRKALLDLVKRLEDEKRQLETELVVQQQLSGQSVRGGPRLGDSAEERSEELRKGTGGQVSSETSDTELDGNDAASSASDNGDEIEEVFYDAAADVRLVKVTPMPTLSVEGLRKALSSNSLEARHLGLPPVGEETPQWLRDELPAPARRDRLPKPAQKEKSVSLWSLIKECVGRDLTRVCLPVYFNEPLSALQKTAEDLEYSELIDAAAECEAGSVERMLLVAAFAVSGYAGTAARTSKPFNPLLGETYECVFPEKGFRAICEKVVHHPTIIAAHCEGRNWTFEGDIELRSKFWGRSIELTPVGILRLSFHDGDVYTWKKVTTSIYNLIIGKLYIDHGGVMKIHSSASGLVCKLRFKEQGLLRLQEAHQVRGQMETAEGLRLERPILVGKWDEAMYADVGEATLRLLWKMNPPPPEPTRYSFATVWPIQLNEVTPGLQEKLCPTDCRLRPDQRFTELGMYDEANLEKQRLEQKQRAARRAAERGEPLHPRWFQPVPGSVQGEQQTFKYKGGYWESRAQRQYAGCRDIFSNGDSTGAVAGSVKPSI